MQARSFSLAILAGLGLSLTFGGAAFAGQTVITGENGQSVTVQGDRQRTDAGATYNRSVTYPNGQTSTSTGTYNRGEDGSYSGSVNRTNRQGESNLYQVNGQRTWGNGTYQNNGTVTGPNGNQATYDRNGTYGNGQFNGTGTLTGPNGQTRNTQVSGQRNGQGNYSGTVNVTGRNGRSRSGSFQRNR